MTAPLPCPPTEPDFASRLSVLVSKEMSDAHGDADRIGMVIERLINSAAFSIAIAAKGDPAGMETFLRGAESYLYESAAGHAPIAQFMAAAKGMPKLPPELRGKPPRSFT